MTEDTIRPDRRMAQPGQRKTYEISRLWDRNREILRLIALGWNNKQIAARLNITPQTVSNTRNSTLGQKHLAIMRGQRDEQVFDAQAKIQELVPEAYRIYEEILTDEDCSKALQKQTADTILKDLAGHAVPKQVDIRSQSLIMEKIEIIKQNAAKSKQAMIDAGVIVEGEFEAVG